MRKDVINLSNLELDFLVSHALGCDYLVKDGAVVTGKTIFKEDGLGYDEVFSPTKNWDQGGPIIQNAGISLTSTSASDGDGDPIWTGTVRDRVFYHPDPLVLAMQQFVVSKLGFSVEFPNELDSDCIDRISGELIEYCITNCKEEEILQSFVRTYIERLSTDELLMMHHKSIGSIEKLF